MNKQKLFLTTREAAEKLSVSPTTVQTWCEAGILKSWKTLGGHRRLDPALKVNLPISSKSDGPGEQLPDEMLLKVLIVEDDQVLLRLYQMQLKSWGLPIEFTFSTNVCDALLTIGRDSKDLLIVDLMLDGSDELKMIRDLAKSHLRAVSAIVVVSGLGQDDIDQRGGLPSEIAVYKKPISFEALKTICWDLIQRRCKWSYSSNGQLLPGSVIQNVRQMAGGNKA